LKKLSISSSADFILFSIGISDFFGVITEDVAAVDCYAKNPTSGKAKFVTLCGGGPPAYP
jgi:hypothetical protein